MLELNVEAWPPFGHSLLDKSKNFSFITKGLNTYIMSKTHTQKVPTHSLVNSSDLETAIIYENLLDYVFRLENNSLYEF